MKHLRQYIRRVLIESAIDPKIMSMIDRAEDAGFRVLLRPGYAAVYDPAIDVSDLADGYVGFKNRIVGVSWHKSPGTGALKCSGARRVVVSSSATPNFGMGPLAYDLAIESSS